MGKLAAVLCFAAVAACHSSSPQCSADAGEDLKPCSPLADGGSPDCMANEACAPFSSGPFRCVAFCDQGGVVEEALVEIFDEGGVESEVAVEVHVAALWEGARK